MCITSSDNPLSAFSFSTGFSLSCSGISLHSFWPFLFRKIPFFFSAMCCDRISLEDLLITKESGVTSPETTASPRPQDHSITISSVFSVTGWTENATHADSASTILCTMTATEICISTNHFSLL